MEQLLKSNQGSSWTTTTTQGYSKNAPNAPKIQSVPGLPDSLNKNPYPLSHRTLKTGHNRENREKKFQLDAPTEAEVHLSAAFLVLEMDPLLSIITLQAGIPWPGRHLEPGCGSPQVHGWAAVSYKKPPTSLQHPRGSIIHRFLTPLVLHIFSVLTFTLYVPGNELLIQ